MSNITVGIIVKNDYDNMLYHENNFFIKIEDVKKDEIKFAVEDKLEQILDKKAFRIESVSKKIPKLDVSNNEENITMCLVEVYMYSDNSDFIPKEDVLEKLSTSLYKDYYIKYIIRYNKYKDLVERYISVFIYISWAIAMYIFSIETKTKFLLDTLFNNFWFGIIVFVGLPVFILYKLVVPRIVNNVVKYDLSEKDFKISKWSYTISYIIFYFTLIINTF